MDETMDLVTAPELMVSRWFNTDEAITLAALRGKVVVIEAFQMLCPGCVSHGLPQTQQIHRFFSSDRVAVIGLHTVFEHHAAMTPVSLQAFIYEYRLGFPIGVDQAGEGHIPKTMQALGLSGTPSLIIIDPAGTIRSNHFGRVPDLQIGAEIATLLSETSTQSRSTTNRSGAEPGCRDGGCAAPASE